MAKKISDILWDAANKHLRDDVLTTGHEKYSCCAVSVAEDEAGVYVDAPWSTVRKKSRALQFLKSLGCPLGGVRAFDKCVNPQGARYLWLMFAYQVALDEGL